MVILLWKSKFCCFVSACPDNLPLFVAIGVLAFLLIAFIAGLLIFCCCPCACCLAMYGRCHRRYGRYEVANAATAMSMVSMVKLSSNKFMLLELNYLSHPALRLLKTFVVMQNPTFVWICFGVACRADTVQCYHKQCNKARETATKCLPKNKKTQSSRAGFETALSRF